MLLADSKEGQGHSGARPAARAAGEAEGGGGGGGASDADARVEVALPSAAGAAEELRPRDALERSPGAAASPVVTDVDPHSHMAPTVWPGAAEAERSGRWRGEGFEPRQQAPSPFGPPSFTICLMCIFIRRERMLGGLVLGPF